MKKFSPIVFLLLFLIACQQSTIQEINTLTESNQTPIFTDEVLVDISKATYEEIIVEINEDKLNLQGFEVLEESVELVAEASNELQTQKTLAASDGFVVYIAKDNGTNEIWRHDQSDDSQILVYSSTRDIQSVAISLDGNTIITSMDRHESGATNKDIFSFVISTGVMKRHTGSPTDELDVSMSGDGDLWVWQGVKADGTKTIDHKDFSTISTGQFRRSVLPLDVLQPSVTQNSKLVSFISYRPGSDYPDGKERWVAQAYNIATKDLFSLIGSFGELNHPSLNDDGTKLLVERTFTTTGKNVIQAFDLIDRAWLAPVISVQDDSVHSHLTADGLFATFSRGAILHSYTKDLTTSSNAPTVIAKDTYQHYWQKPSTLAFDAGYDSVVTPAATIDFGTVALGTTSSVQALEISEIGTSDLRVGYAIVGSSASEFAVSPVPSLTLADGSTSQTLSITCTPAVAESFTADLIVYTNDITQLHVIYTLTCKGGAVDLFFSEYGEGSSNNKWLEIYNGTAAAIDLSDYQLERVSNGGTFSTGAIQALSGNLAVDDTYIVCHTSADASIIGSCDFQAGIYINHNGNDAYALRKISNNSIVDVVGTEGADPGTGWAVAGTNDATKDHTLVRKATICSGNTDWDISRGTDATNSEWIVEAKDDFSFAGVHTGCQ